MGTRRPALARGVPIALGVAAALGIAAVASAELRLSLSAEGAASAMGAPLRHRVASPDQVTSASLDAITGASRLASSGGVHVLLERGEGGALALGLEYVHYRFDIDYEVARARMDVVALRVLATARLTLVRVRSAPLLTLGFGAYLELPLLDRAVLSGSWLELELAPASAGIAFELHLVPWRFALSGQRGRLAPTVFLRAYRGVTPGLRDELGSDAPLCSAALGLGLLYELPARADGP